MEHLKIISAGAGSGKTYTLTKKMTELLSPQAGEKAAIRASGIIATTFTNKAAAELQERVRVALLEQGLSTEADELENAMIGTVHAIGVQLLKRFAFEAGISPDVDIIADNNQQNLFNQSLATVLSTEKIKALGALTESLGLEKDPFNKRDWRRDLKELTDVARSNNFTPALLEESKQYSLETFFKLVPPPSKKSATAYNEELLHLLKNTIAALQHNDDTTKSKNTLLSSLKSILFELKNKGKIAWHLWAKLSKLKAPKKSREDCADLIEYAQDHAKHPDFHKDIRLYISSIFDLAIAALEEYAQYKKRRGLIDYTDMEVLILELLQNPTVLEVLEDEIDLLLVDEFQDTSPIQLEIFLKLSSIAQQAIWVGDPKQSIYGFRGASPELMQAVVEEADKHNNVEVLKNSWRSRQDLVDSVNAIFTRAFDDIPVERVALETAPPFIKEKEAKDLSTAIQHWHFQFEGGRAPGKPWTEDCIGVAVKKLLEKGLKVRQKGSSNSRALVPGDIAILCRSNHACKTVAESLMKQGIKASVSMEGLLDTAEANLILATLKYILNEKDSLSIAEILLLAEGLSLEEIIEGRLEHLQAQEAAEQRLNWAKDTQYIKLLRQLRSQAKELSATEILNLVIEKLDLRRVISTWSNPEKRLDNVEVLRQFALQYEEDCNRLHSAATLGGFLIWISDLSERGEDKQGSGSGVDAVNVLTYHKSKGLEWPFVLCHNLDSKQDENIGWKLRIETQSEQINLQNPLANRLLCYWVNPYSNQVKGTDLMERMQEQSIYLKLRDNALREEARLLYVGLTRPRDYLVFSSVPKKDNKWLNRVYHKGAEKTPVLDSFAQHCPWLWNEELIEIETQIFNYGNVIARSVAQEPQSIEYLPEQKGEREFRSAQLDSALELFPDLCMQEKATQQVAPKLELNFEAEEIEQFQQALLSINTFIKADRLEEFSYEDRLLLAQNIIREQQLEEQLQAHNILHVSSACQQRIKDLIPGAVMRHNIPFKMTRRGQSFRSVLDMAFEQGDQALALIHIAQFNLEDVGVEHKIEEEIFRLEAARQTLFRAKKEHYYFIYFPLQGALVEYNLAKQTTMV